MTDRGGPDVRGRSPGVLAGLAGFGGACLIGFAGCETTVTEYHRRPGFYKLASEVELQDEMTAADGRRLVFIEDGLLPSEAAEERARQEARAEAAREERARLRREAVAAGRPIPPEAMEPEPAKAFQAREVMEDGSIVFRAVFPEHVIGNVMTCLRNQEYVELWEQVVADSTRRRYASFDQGLEQFVEWCVRHRSELMMSLNRMSFGYYGGSDVVVDRLPDLSVRVRFSAQLGSRFKFREVLIVQERDGMKLAGIR